MLIICWKNRLSIDKKAILSTTIYQIRLYSNLAIASLLFCCCYNKVIGFGIDSVEKKLSEVILYLIKRY
jgi:hypothetical protein